MVGKYYSYAKIKYFPRQHINIKVINMLKWKEIMLKKSFGYSSNPWSQGWQYPNVTAWRRPVLHNTVCRKGRRCSFQQQRDNSKPQSWVGGGRIYFQDSWGNRLTNPVWNSNFASITMHPFKRLNLLYEYINILIFLLLSKLIRLYFKKYFSPKNLRAFHKPQVNFSHP